MLKQGLYTQLYLHVNSDDFAAISTSDMCKETAAMTSCLRGLVPEPRVGLVEHGAIACRVWPQTGSHHMHRHKSRWSEFR